MTTQASDGEKISAAAAKAKKPQLQLVPPAVNTECAPAMEEGLNKYGLCSWRNGPLSLMEMIGAIRRHTDALLRGEWIDPSSPTGKSHVGAIIASAGIIADAKEVGTLVDDRPPLERKPPETPAAHSSPDLEFRCGCGHSYGDHGPNGCSVIREIPCADDTCIGKVLCICKLSRGGK